jgi:hypothetical protein
MEYHEQVWKVLKLEHRSDYHRFSVLMKSCAYLLKDAGVKIARERITGRKATTGEKYSYTRWTIGAPRWAPWRPPT